MPNELFLYLQDPPNHIRFNIPPNFLIGHKFHQSAIYSISVTKFHVTKFHVAMFRSENEDQENVNPVNTIFGTIAKGLQRMVGKDKTKEVQIGFEKEKSEPIVDDYQSDIYDVYHECELKYRVPINFLDNQEYIDQSIRTILVDWLMEYHAKCKLQNDSLHLAILLIDRYLMKHSIPKSDIQILYIGALRLACKYNELNPIRGISSTSFTKDEIIQMESVLLREFDYNITHFSTIVNFLKRYNVEPEVMIHANYLAEITLLYTESYQYLPSDMALAAIHLASKHCGRESKLGARMDICNFISKLKPKKSVNQKYNLE
jgi:hypothetical protein